MSRQNDLANARGLVQTILDMEALKHLAPSEIDELAGAIVRAKDEAVETLTRAMLKIAPEEVTKIADKYKRLADEEQKALEEFLVALGGKASLPTGGGGGGQSRVFGRDGTSGGHAGRAGDTIVGGKGGVANGGRGHSGWSRGVPVGAGHGFLTSPVFSGGGGPGRDQDPNEGGAGGPAPMRNSTDKWRPMSEAQPFKDGRYIVVKCKASNQPPIVVRWEHSAAGIGRWVDGDYLFNDDHFDGFAELPTTSA